MQNDIPEPVHLSRRHLLKALGVAAGAAAASLPRSAKAQENPDHDGGGWGWGHCFLRGTLIRTINGYRAIETLVVGGILPTRFSGTAAIKKLVRYSVTRDDYGHWPEDCRPVRIGAGALGENAPFRDLIVTNAHAMFLDGALVPVDNLVNGRTIVFEDDPLGSFTLEYFHVEFDAHDVIDAEGALCESRRDAATMPCAPILSFTGGRSRLYSHLRSAIAPFVDRRQPLDLIRDNLEMRAGF